MWLAVFGIGVLAVFLALAFMPKRKYNKNEADAGMSIDGGTGPSHHRDGNHEFSDGGGGDGGGGD